MMQDTTTAPINYAYLTGTLQGILSMLPSAMLMNKLVTPDQVESISEFIQSELERSAKVEREFTSGR